MELLHMQARRHVSVIAPRYAAEIALRSRRLARAQEGSGRSIASDRDHGRPGRLSRRETAGSAQRSGARALGA
jgi:hypothetical protein